MALDATKVLTHPGTLTYTPAIGTGGSIGFTAQGVEVVPAIVYQPIDDTEEWGDTPLDYLLLGGSVIVTVEALQLDAATRAAIAKHAIAANDELIFTPDNVGQLASSLSGGTLTFAASVSGRQSFEATRAVVISGRESSLRFSLRRRRRASYSCAFACLPDPANSNRQIRFYPQP